MKQLTLLLIFVCTLATGVSIASTTYDESRKVENLIKSQIGSSSQHIDRSIGPVLEAYIYESSRQIEVVCSGEGIVTAYIVDVNGGVYDIVEFDSETCFSGRLNIPINMGAFYLVIYTEHTYAEAYIQI
ncbi:MAG: hypothetical protein IJX11_01130 [Bacteroidales bacterium]|nr:hypothetical protein [Bacteroidales bacterium]